MSSIDSLTKGEILVWMSLNKTLKPWREFFEREEIKDMLRNIEKHIEKSDFCPHVKHIFRVFKYVPPGGIRIVILGMDPYQSRRNGKNRANGIAFGTDLNEIPKSLSNIYKEIAMNGYQRPRTADLKYLLRQGVFLLNSALTVEYDKSGSHNRLWRGFTIELLKWIIAKCRKSGYECCFFLWGKKAQSIAAEAKINSNDKWVFTAAHPSPFSANRGFIGCKHFKLVNDLFREKGFKEINWGND